MNILTTITDYTLTTIFILLLICITLHIYAYIQQQRGKLL